MTAPQRQGAAAVGTGAADAELAQLVGCPDRNGAEDLVTFFQLETRPTGATVSWSGTGPQPGQRAQLQTPAPLIARWGTLPLEAGAELAGWMTGRPSEAHG